MQDASSVVWRRMLWGDEIFMGQGVFGVVKLESISSVLLIINDLYIKLLRSGAKRNKKKCYRGYSFCRKNWRSIYV